MAKKGENKNPKCATKIPRDWAQYSGPSYASGMSVREAAAAWSEWVRRCRRLGPTPRVYRGAGE